MTDDRWEQFVEDGKTRFKDVVVKDETWSDDRGDEIQTGTQNVIEFTLVKFISFITISFEYVP